MKCNVRTAAVFLILLCLLPGTLGVAELALPSYYGDTYYAELPEMYARLNAADSPKLVVVGGSSVAFGLDGALLEELLARQGYDYTVCPFGLYAAVGTSAMLDLSLGALREGDMVILALEPTSETMSAYFGATSFWKCAEDAPELLWPLDREKKSALAGNYIPYLQERWAIFKGGIPPSAEGVYAKAAFNDRCDMAYDRPGNIMALGADLSEPIDLSGVAVSEEFAAQVERFCRQAARRGAAVCLSFSPMNRSALTDTGAEALERYFQLCNDAFPCTVISDPNRYILDSGWFYDSNFHLNSAGAALRTALLAEDILAQLGCYKPLDYDPPEMPPSAYTAPESAGDGEDFLFRPIENSTGQPIGYLVAGLSERGRAREALSVPAVYQGLPVAGIAADALSGAGALLELRLPASIQSLPGGVFAGAASLTRLILEHTDALCDVEEDTFAGADQLRVYVPAGAYPLYRDGQGCETSPWAPYLDRIVTIG